MFDDFLTFAKFCGNLKSSKIQWKLYVAAAVIWNTFPVHVQLSRSVRNISRRKIVANVSSRRWEACGPYRRPAYGNVCLQAEGRHINMQVHSAKVN